MVRLISPKVMETRITFIVVILVMYFEANDLSLVTSLVTNGSRPRSAIMPKIPVKARTKDKTPKPSVPKYLAINITHKKYRNLLMILPANNTTIFLATF